MAFTNESQKFARGVLYTALVSLVHRNPWLGVSKAIKKLPANIDVSATAKIVAPITDKVLNIPRSKATTLIRLVVMFIAALPSKRHIQPYVRSLFLSTVCYPFALLCLPSLYN